MAVHGQHILTWARPAGADLSANQFAPLTLDVNNDLVLANVAADNIAGVLWNKPASGAHATAVLEGITKMRAGAAVTLGTLITVQSATFIAAVSGGLAKGKAWETVTSGAIFTGQPLQVAHVMTTSFS